MTIHGKQVDLKIYTPPPEGYEEAVREGERLKAEMAKGAVPAKVSASTPPPPPPAPKAPTVAAEVERYRAEVFTRKPPATQQAYHHRLNWIVTHFGRVVVSDLTPTAVELAVEKEPGWGDSTRRLTLSVMQLLVRWSGRKEFTLLKPAGGMRDERCVLTREEFQAVLAECHGDFGPLIKAMLLCGCRPGEGRSLRVDQVNWQSGRAILHEHKTKGKTGRPKSLYASDLALKILVEQREKYGSGLLFRGIHGQMLSAAAVQHRWRRIRKLLGLRSQVVPYSLRHSFATHLLEAGESSRDVAEMLGHTSTAMVEKHYGHFVNPGRLRKVAGRLDSIVG